jgi:flagellar biosynthesis protein FlhF
MLIKKYNGNSRDEAINNAKNDLGPNVVIMNIREIRPKGLLGIFKSSTYEVTGALEDDQEKRVTRPSAALGEGGHFDALAGEEAVVSHVEHLEKSTVKDPSDSNSLIKPDKSLNEKINNEAQIEQNKAIDPSLTDEKALAESSLKDAFAAVDSVIKKSEGRSNAKYANEEDKRLDDLLNKKAKPEKKEDDFVELKDSLHEKSETKVLPLNRQFVSMMYNVLLSNDVDEEYVNQILHDMEKVIRSGDNLDYLLSNVYQKMILMMGKPKTITLGESKPRIVFLIGPTGVGKTTTIAKIASAYKLKFGKKVGMLTTDTYRIAATDQLRTYSDILGVPLDVVLTKDDLNEAIAKMGGLDIIFVDTAGFSHKNTEQKKEMANILSTLDTAYEKDVYLVLSAATKYRDLKNIVDIYKEFTDFSLIFTKTDETETFGNIFNIKLYSGADLSYVCDGQGVPDDISVINIQHLVKRLLGGK